MDHLCCCRVRFFLSPRFPHLISLSNFLYISLVDIMPQLHVKKRERLPLFLQIGGFLLGVLILFVIALFESHHHAECGTGQHDSHNHAH